jgi:avidin family protein
MKEIGIATSFLARRSSAGKVDFSGHWRNQRGSSIELAVDDRGRVSGTFRTGVGVPLPEESFPLCGIAQGDLIAFSVGFGVHESVTAWAGQHTIAKGRERIETLWHLARNIGDEDEDRALWAAILSGADTFERG